MTPSPYRWLHRLGAGSAGVVWAAERDGVRLAVKVLRTQAIPSLAETIRREMRIGPMIADHPNVVGVRRVEEVGGVLHLEMDLVRGPSLDQIIEGRVGARRGGIAPSIAVPWMADVLDALGWVGRTVAPAAPSSFCHRDIKPANILLDPSGIVRITDFGVARAAAELGFQTTATGVVKGSPRFMAPEVIAERAPDAHADQFSVAVVLFELITGLPLYEGRDLAEVLMLAVQADVERRLQLVRAPTELLAVMRKMLARNPADRFATPELAASALRAVRLTGPAVRDVLHELMTYAPDLSDDDAPEDNGSTTRELVLDEGGATDPNMIPGGLSSFLGPPNRTMQGGRALPTFHATDDHPTRPAPFDELHTYGETDATTDVSELLSDVTPALDELPGPPMALREPQERPSEPSEATPVAPGPMFVRPPENPSELPTQVMNQADIDAEMRRMLEQAPPARAPKAPRPETPAAPAPDAGMGVELWLIAIGVSLFVVGSAGAVAIITFALVWNARP